MFAFGPVEIMGLLILGVLVFGKELPEVGKTVGKFIADLRGTARELQDTFHRPLSGGTGYHAPAPAYEPPKPPTRLAPTAPKFSDDLM